MFVVTVTMVHVYIWVIFQLVEGESENSMEEVEGALYCAKSVDAPDTEMLLDLHQEDRVRVKKKDFWLFVCFGSARDMTPHISLSIALNFIS